MFSSRLSLADLSSLSRALRHNIGAGLSLVDVFSQQSMRGAPGVRPVAKRIADSLKTGDSLMVALEKEKASFPTLFLSLAQVGEESGHLPEVFKELEQYYELEQRQRKQFISQSFLPAIQFVFAVCLISGLIWVLGLIAESRPGQKPIAIFGLSGTRGALTFFFTVFGAIFSVLLVYVVAKRQFRNVAKVDALLLRVPVFGGLLESIAMARLALAMQLTLDSGMTIMKAMRLSLKATGNSAFAVHADAVAAALKKKKPLSEALTLVPCLPREFVDLVATAEEGGRVPEMMRHQAAMYQEETSRRMMAVTRLATGGLWLLYAGCMVYAIFQIAKIYLSALGI